MIEFDGVKVKPMIRVAIVKQSAQGESIQVDVPSWNPVTGAPVLNSPDEVAAVVDRCWELVDLRLEEMNVRTIEAFGLKSFIVENYGMGIWMKMNDILEIVHGRQSPATVIARWNSIKEENEALEKQRAEARTAKVQENGA